VETQTPEGLPGFVPEGFFVDSAHQSGAKSAQVGQKSRKVGHHVGHVPAGFLGVTEAGKRLGMSHKTVTRWCESGKLSAVPQSYGNKTTYLISIASIEEAIQQTEQPEPARVTKRSSETPIRNERANRPHASYFDSWVTAMTGGLLTGKAFSKRTVDDYKFYVKPFLDKGQEVSIVALKEELMAIPVEQVAKRQHLYKALVCFGKYLVSEEALGIEFIERAKPFYPKRHVPPKRSSIDESEMKQLLGACSEPLERFIVTLLGHTGLRASEACQLTWADVDLEKPCLTVQKGKGGKRRVIGLTAVAREAFVMYRSGQPGTVRDNETILRDRLGQPMTRSGLYQRLERIGVKAGVKVSPHTLRRAFVTLNANKGRPLQMLQMACGHSDIKTTMSYCMTSEQEVVDAMKGWD
jgi:integrase/recombinase XerD